MTYRYNTLISYTNCHSIVSNHFARHPTLSDSRSSLTKHLISRISPLVMNLSSLVHGGRQPAEAYPAEAYPQYTPSRHQAMASPVVANPYTAQPLTHQQTHYAYVNAPQPPPSPPVDETAKCSLPSISSLLGLADGPPQEKTQQHQQGQWTVDRIKEAILTPTAPQSQIYRHSPAMSSRGALPPTPPMQSEHAFDERSSPSRLSSSGYSAVSPPGYYLGGSSGSAVNNLEPHAQRQHIPEMSRRVSPPPIHMSYSQSQSSSPLYNVSPSQPSMNGYYPSPMQYTPPQSQVSGLYYQRPLPQVCFRSFTTLILINKQQQYASLVPVPMTLAPSSSSPRWQHHHYISPSSAASFPQSQDRYICQTCNKAFSRPSSLRIHSHSHTGEKPFKCQHRGCGKAFSVRSNMKRHERGCHSFEGTPTTMTS